VKDDVGALLDEAVDETSDGVADELVDNVAGKLLVDEIAADVVGSWEVNELVEETTENGDGGPLDVVGESVIEVVDEAVDDVVEKPAVEELLVDVVAITTSTVPACC